MAPSSSWSGRQIFILETGVRVPVVLQIWGCSSVGRAPALQAGGREFESHQLHKV